MSNDIPSGVSGIVVKACAVGGSIVVDPVAIDPLNDPILNPLAS